MYMRNTALVLIVLTLVACNKPPQDVVPDNAAASLPAAPGAVTPDAASEPDNGVMIKVTPVKTEDCEPSKYVADVSWTVPPGLAMAGIEIRVDNPEGGLLAFAMSPEGQKRSGRWVSKDAAFYVVDKQTREVLKQARAPDYDCR